MSWRLLTLAALVLRLATVEGNLFVTTDANRQLRGGVTCSKDTTTNPDTLSVRLIVYEPSYDFRDDDGNLIHFDCQILENNPLHQPSRTRIVPSDLSTCGNSKYFSRMLPEAATTTGPIDRSHKRTLYKDVTIGTDFGSLLADQEVECGAYYDVSTSVLGFSATCYREEDFDKEYDQVIHFNLDINHCVDEMQITNQIEVEGPGFIYVSRDYVVSLDIYSAGNSRNPFAVTTPQSSGPLTTAIPLGQSIYAEACIAIGADDRTYFVEGHSVLGLHLSSCTVTPDTTGNGLFDSPSAVDVTDATGCGKNVSPMEAWEFNMYQFRYAKGGINANLPWYSSPNCFRSDAFEAVSFSRLNINVDSKWIMECDVTYCRSTSDPVCFGSVNTGSGVYPGDDYQQCVGNTGRKRRQAVNSTDENSLPSRLSFTFTVENPYMTKESASAKPADAESCFKKVSFVSMSAVMALLIVLLLCVDVFLATRLRGYNHDDVTPTGSKSGSEHSVAGFTNKGYY